MGVSAAADAEQPLSFDVIEIEAARFWRDAYSVIYPAISFREFLTDWKLAKRALGSSRQD
jgi:hypothetical protein